MIKTIKIERKKPPTESAEVHPQVISIGGVFYLCIMASSILLPTGSSGMSG